MNSRSKKQLQVELKDVGRMGDWLDDFVFGSECLDISRRTMACCLYLEYLEYD